ncbi:hypothetical protein LCGC14_2643450, partial [marine sediment metagenome]
IPKQVKLDMINYETQNMVVAKEYIENREYLFNTDPLYTLEEGEEYTAIQVDVLAREDYQFTYKLTDHDGNPIKDSIIWMQLGFVAKSEAKFLNDRAIIEELEAYPYYESLGTDLYTANGPGLGPNKMFGRPLTYQTKDISNYYGPYVWDYRVTDEYGEVSFDLSFDEDYFYDSVQAFGSMESIQSVEDVVLYMRIISTQFDWDEFAIQNPEQYKFSENGMIYDGSTKLVGYDDTALNLQDQTYIEGILRFYKGDIAVATSDYLSYDLPDPDIDPTYEDLQISLYVTEADPIPTAVSTTLDSLTKVYTASELEALPINILDEGITYSVLLDVLDVSGNNRFHTELPITPTIDGGIISLGGDEVENIISSLPPGVNTINLQVKESNYYKKSPIITMPLEIRSPNYFKFGEKNTKIDLINPFVSAWGSSFDGEDFMKFESNYPHLIGTLWIDPDF